MPARVGRSLVKRGFTRRPGLEALVDPHVIGRIQANAVFDCLVDPGCVLEVVAAGFVREALSIVPVADLTVPVSLTPEPTKKVKKRNGDGKTKKKSDIDKELGI